MRSETVWLIQDELFCFVCCLLVAGRRLLLYLIVLLSSRRSNIYRGLEQKGGCQETEFVVLSIFWMERCPSLLGWRHRK